MQRQHFILLSHIFVKKHLQLIANFFITLETNINVYDVAAHMIRIPIIRQWLSACVNLDLGF